MATGTLKMWKAERGFGFILNDAGGPDMFLHITALESAGIDPDSLRPGERLTFDVEAPVTERPRLATFGGPAEGEG